MAECNVQELMDEAKCFGCGLSSRTLEVLQLQLLCNISETGPSGLFLAQAANLSDVDDEAAARENLGVGLTDSPVFTGATLSGMTPGSVLFAGPGGAVAQDNATFFFNDTTDALQLGARGTGTVVPVLNRLEAIRDITGGAAGAANVNIYAETKVSGVNTGATITAGQLVTSMSGGTASILEGLSAVTLITGGTVTSSYGVNVTNFNIAGTVTSMYGIAGNCLVNGGTTTNVFGLQFGVSVSGTATTAYGLDVTVTGAGTITNGYGLYVRTPFSGTVNTALYGIFNDIGRASAIGMVIKGAAVQTGDLLQFQNSAGTVLTKVLAGGNVLGISGTAAAPMFSFVSDPDTGIYSRDDNVIGFTAGAGLRMILAPSLIRIANDMAIQWSATGDPFAAADLALTRAAAGKLSLSTGSAMYFPDGTAGAPSISFASDTDTGMYWGGSGALDFSANGSNIARMSSSDLLILRDAVSLAWGSSGFTAPDLFLLRDAANTLAQRNGVNAQAFRNYSTYTNGANYRYVSFEGSFTGGQPGVYGFGAGTGANTDLYISAQRDLFLSGSGSVAHWKINSSGHLLTVADNSFDIGASGSTRPRALYLGGGVTHGSATILTTTTALTNGAGIGAATILNAPVAGNPTKWAPINDNGTVRYCPLW